MAKIKSVCSLALTGHPSCTCQAHTSYLQRERVPLCNQITDFSECSLKSTLKSGCNYIGLTDLLICKHFQVFLRTILLHFYALRELTRVICRTNRTSFSFPLYATFTGSHSSNPSPSASNPIFPVLKQANPSSYFTPSGPSTMPSWHFDLHQD